MYLAIDVGGTKTLLGVFSEKGELKEKVRFETAQDYEDFKTILADNVANLTTKDFQACCAAIPGRVNRKTGVGIAFGNLPWQNVSIEEDVEKIINAPVVLENDSKVAALYEANNIINEFKKVLYVTIGTGISAGLIVNGSINLEFADSESGHMLLEHGGKLQTWESFASGKAITKRFGKKASEINDEDSWKEISRNIAIGLIDLVAVIQPDVIVLGGGVGSHFDKFEKYLKLQMKQYEMPLVPIPPIRKASKPEEAVLFGCYYLAKEKYGKAD